VAVDDRSGPHLSTPPAAPAAPGATRDDGDRYEEIALLGAGGMGRVHAVYDARLGRQVARKRPRPDQPSALAAIRREAELTARLEHPGIVPIYDAGRDPDGSPWYTMRLIRGRTLRDVIAGRPTIEARLGLLRPVLAAVQAVAYAHARGVVHCDLKPSNLLLGEHGEVQVIDWGLASSAPRGGGGGTPAAMAPEQAAGGGATAASDVWALGLILAEVLLGQPPDPAEARRGGVLPLGDAVPADLRAIVARCLRPAPDARYPDASALADDLARFLDGRLVRAHDYTAGELFGRWIERNRVALAVAAVGAVVVAALAGVAAVRVVAERDAALSAERAAVAAQRAAEVNYAEALALAARTAAARGARPEAEVLAAAALTLAELPEARGVLAAFGAAPRPAWQPAPLGTCEGRWTPGQGRTGLCTTARAVSLLDGGQVRWRVDRDVAAAGFLGTDVIASGRGNLAIVLDGATGAPVRPPFPIVSGDGVQSGRFGALVVSTHFFQVVSDRGAAAPAYHPCGDAPVVGSVEVGGGRWILACDVGQLKTFDARSGETTPIDASGFVHRGPFRQVDLAPDGGIAIGTDQGEVTVLVDGEPRFVAQVRETVTALRFTPDGRRLVVGQWTDGPVVLDAQTGAVLARLPAWVGRLHGLEAPARAVFTGRGGVVWDLDALAPVWFKGNAGLAHLTPTADGVLLGRGDGGIRRVARDGGRVLAQGSWIARPVKGVVELSDGSIVSIAAEGGTARSTPDLATHTRISDQIGRRVGLLGRHVVSLPYLGGGLWFDLEAGTSAAFDDGGPAWLDLGTSPDGRRAVALDEDGRIWSLVAGDPPTARVVGEALDATAVDIADDGTIVFVKPGSLAVWGADGVRSAVPCCEAMVPDLALSPAGDRVAVAGLDGATRILDLRTGRALAVLEGHAQRVSVVAWDREDELWTGSWDGAARVWDTTALTRDPHALLREAEQAWGMTVAEAVAAGAP
jgi:WD40 repeat protein